MKEPTYHCPECGGDKVTAEHCQMFMVNTGDHYCHSTKTTDPDSRATCLDCGWEGVQENLTEKNGC